jgi:ribosomal protein L5
MSGAKTINRLRSKYEGEVVPALRKEFGYTNVMAVPRLVKVVVNMGLGEGTQNAKIVDTGAEELAPRSRSRSSRCAATCRSARWSRCAGSGCTSSSTG